MNVPTGPRARILAVTSGKGGVGKTATAVYVSKTACLPSPLRLNPAARAIRRAGRVGAARGSSAESATIVAYAS